MYYVTFKLPLKSFLTVLVSPLSLALLFFIVYSLKDYIFQIDHLFLSLTVNIVLFFLISIIYIQMTKEYDVVLRLKVLLEKGKNYKL